MKRTSMFFIIVLLLFGVEGATAKKQPSLYDTHPEIFSKQYTPDEIATIKQNFDNNPLQHSQELGNLMLWQMHQKSPEFAKEFAQTPELNDGIDAKKARAILAIYEVVKDLDIKPDLFEKKEGLDENSDRVIMEWQGNSKEKSDWGGFIYQSPQGGILNAQPVNFEPEDSIDYGKLANGELRWKSMSAYGDRDGIIVTLKYPSGNKVFFDMNGQMLSFTKMDLLTKDSIVFNEEDGLEGTLTIKKAYTSSLPNELLAVRDLVLAGEGDKRYSAPLQALLWGYMDGHFKEGDNPFKDYIDVAEFVKPIWGDMKGPRWEDFKEVTSRLNLPELVDYYTQRSFTYYDVGFITRPPSVIFHDKQGHCLDYSLFIRSCLRKAGYEAYVYDMLHLPKPHKTVGYRDKDNKWYTIDNGRDRPGGISGPFGSESELKETLSCVRYYGVKRF